MIAYERIGSTAAVSWLNAAAELAWIHLHANRYAQAERLYETVLESALRLLGDDGDRTVMTRVNLGVLLTRDGRGAEAVPHLVEALAAAGRREGESSVESAEVLERLVNALESAGDLAGAERVLAERLPGLVGGGLIGPGRSAGLSQRLEGLRAARAGPVMSPGEGEGAAVEVDSKADSVPR
jgi:tetratricopeptide (TPR) repeat protein